MASFRLRLSMVLIASCMLLPQVSEKAHAFVIGMEGVAPPFASVSANPVSDWALIDDPLAPGNGAYLGEVDFDVTSLVQSWFDTPASNNGVSYGIGGSAYPYNTIDPYVFTSDADGALAAYRPTLTIEFEGGEAKVSEPGGIMMLGLGLAGIVVIRRRCKAG